MAERRMFAKTIIDSDAFLDMPQSSQALYFHLAMRADDDGFINNPKSIMRNVKCSEDDFKLLCVKKFIIPFESGVVVIKHWKIHNYIAKDRYNETKCKNEKALLTLDENNAYRLPSGDIPALSTECIQVVDECETQVRLGKDRIGKVSEGKSIVRFKPPTITELTSYCQERNNTVDPQRFIDHYTSNGWMVGKNKMKDWKASVRTWEKGERNATLVRGTNASASSGKTTRPRFDFSGTDIPV